MNFCNQNSVNRALIANNLQKNLIIVSQLYCDTFDLWLVGIGCCVTHSESFSINLLYVICCYGILTHQVSNDTGGPYKTPPIPIPQRPTTYLWRLVLRVYMGDGYTLARFPPPLDWSVTTASQKTGKESKKYWTKGWAWTIPSLYYSNQTAEKINLPRYIKTFRVHYTIIYPEKKSNLPPQLSR